MNSVLRNLLAKVFVTYTLESKGGQETECQNRLSPVSAMRETAVHYYNHICYLHLF